MTFWIFVVSLVFLLVALRVFGLSGFVGVAIASLPRFESVKVRHRTDHAVPLLFLSRNSSVAKLCGSGGP